jgi:hypothetical protein
MPLTFRRRIKLFPGLYLNIGRRGVSLTGRAGPVSVTRSTTGRRTTSVNLPGPLGYRSTTTAAGRARKAAELQARKDAALAAREARRRRS